MILKVRKSADYILRESFTLHCAGNSGISFLRKNQGTSRWHQMVATCHHQQGHSQRLVCEEPTLWHWAGWPGRGSWPHLLRGIRCGERDGGCSSGSRAQSSGHPHSYYRAKSRDIGYSPKPKKSLMLGNRQANVNGHEWFSVRMNTRYVVGPGSLHPNGNPYAVGSDIPPAPIPDWLRNGSPAKPLMRHRR